MNRKIIVFAALLLVSIMSAGCQLGGNGETSDQPLSGYYQTGTASWYGAEYHGRDTASGEKFDKNALTAAHRELAFGTWVEVTNLGNGRRVTVRINDREPFVEGRIIDLSERAADEIGMKIAGLAEVALTIVAGP